MLAQALAAIDIIAGIAIAGQTYLGWNPVILVGIAILCKAVYSLATSISTHFYFDFLGWIDLAAAVIILMNLQIPWFFLIMLIKGVASLATIRI